MVKIKDADINEHRRYWRIGKKNKMFPEFPMPKWMKQKIKPEK